MIIRLFTKWWVGQHGKHLSITTTVCFSSIIMLLLCLYQILTLQDHPDWGQHTGLAIVLAVVAFMFIIVSGPEMLVLRGHLNTLEEIKQIDSISELRRQKSDGNFSASVLGAGHDVAWGEFLQSKGLRR